MFINPHLSEKRTVKCRLVKKHIKQLLFTQIGSYTETNLSFGSLYKCLGDVYIFCSATIYEFSINEKGKNTPTVLTACYEL